MNLHEELTEGIRCKLCAFLEDVRGTGERTHWVTELALPARLVGHKAVVAALRRRGYTVTEASVRRHRRNHGA
jgi:hypothetical protein